MKYLPIILILLFSCEKYVEPDMMSFTDERDGQTYATIDIGGKTWMAENLNYIPPQGGVGYYVTDKCGILYSFNNAVRYCPEGWRLPTDEEWIELKEYYPDELSLRSGEFNAKLSGWVQGEYMNEGAVAVWWTGTECYNDYAWVYYFSIWESSTGKLSRTNFYKTNMACVRCIKE